MLGQASLFKCDSWWHFFAGLPCVCYCCRPWRLLHSASCSLDLHPHWSSSTWTVNGQSCWSRRGTTARFLPEVAPFWYDEWHLGLLRTLHARNGPTWKACLAIKSSVDACWLCLRPRGRTQFIFLWLLLESRTFAPSYAPQSADQESSASVYLSASIFLRGFLWLAGRRWTSHCYVDGRLQFEALGPFLWAFGSRPAVRFTLQVRDKKVRGNEQMKSCVLTV